MIDQRSDVPPAGGDGDPEGSWLERARLASVTLLTLIDRNPHGAFLTGFPVEPWSRQERPLPRAG